MPPSAATRGSAARRGSDSSPWWISRRISRPTTKKKIVMRPSFTTHARERSKVKVPSRSPRGSSQSAAHAGARGELAIASATAAATSKSTPLAASTARKRSSGRRTVRAARTSGDQASGGASSDGRDARDEPGGDDEGGEGAETSTWHLGRGARRMAARPSRVLRPPRRPHPNRSPYDAPTRPLRVEESRRVSPSCGAPRRAPSRRRRPS